MKLNGTMPAVSDDEKAMYDELNKVSDSPVRTEVWEKVDELEKFDKTKYDDDEDEESSAYEEEAEQKVVAETKADGTTKPSKKRKREEQDEDEDYDECDEESDEEADSSNGDEDEDDVKIELEEQKLDELASSGALVNEEEAEIEDAIPLDRLGEGNEDDEDEESLLDS
jgi:hypothetical protein